jgi:hypothetical protein
MTMARALSISRTHAAAVTGILNGGVTNFNRALSSTITSAAALARRMTMGRAQSNSVSHTAALTRAVARARALSSTIAHSALLARQIGRVRALSSAIATAATAARQGVFGRVLTSTIQHIAAVLASLSPFFTPTPIGRFVQVLFESRSARMAAETHQVAVADVRRTGVLDEDRAAVVADEDRDVTV